MKKINKIISITLITLMSLLSGCNEGWLDLYPLDDLSTASFYSSEADAYLALVGLYYYGIELNVYGDKSYERWRLSACTDDGVYKGQANDYVPSTHAATHSLPTNSWKLTYSAIHKTNDFLSNINKVDMDAAKKAEFIAEARFLRAYSYFILSQFFGGVPLVTEVLTIDEANNISRNSKTEVVEFCLTELTEAAKDLPASRPPEEKGRILKSAALAYKGRLLMAEERWNEAAETYKQIIDLGVHNIDPRFKELFEVGGEASSEIIFSMERVAGTAGNYQTQVWLFDQIFGGYSVVNYFQNAVDAFLMIDGKPIEESPMYNPNKPFENRDPRLYASIFLPNYSTWEGRLYKSHPDSSKLGVAAGAGYTGYGQKKFTKEYYVGDNFSSGADLIYVRYSEVLLGYLESNLEAGNNITLDLLNQTINKVRGRNAVKVAPVTETDKNLLRKIVRRERRCEFLGEPIIRYWDIMRWKIANEVLKGECLGIKITDSPDTYKGKYKINKDGHIIMFNKTLWDDHYYLFPIPQSELNINKNLEQNPGY